MSTTRDLRNGYNRKRATNLIQAQRERGLNQQRKTDEPETDDLEHDAQRETDLIDGTWAEQEAVNDPINKW